MAYPAFRNQSSNTGETVSSLVVTKPSGVAVGDVLYAFALGVDGTSHTITLSGWTSVLADSGAQSYYVFKRIADASDVPASNYTFSYSTTVDVAVAAILAVANPAPGYEIQDEFFDYIDSTPSSVATLSGTATPRPNNESLVITYFLAYDFNLSAVLTSSVQTLTPTATLNKRIETGVRTISNDGGSIFVTTGQYQGTADITGCTFTLSEALGSGTDIAVGGVVVINGVQNATVSNALLETTPVAFSPLTGSTQTLNNEFHETTPDFFNQTVVSLSPTQWANETITETEWTNEQI